LAKKAGFQGSRLVEGMKLTIVMRTEKMFELKDNDAIYRRSQSELERLVQQRTAAVRDLSAQLQRIQEEERRHLARQLHDSTGQILIALKIHLARLEAKSKATAETAELFTHVAELADEALQEIRTSSYLLYPPLLDESGFCCAAEWYVDGFAKRSGIEVRLHFTPKSRWPREIEAALFRVLQESLTNIHRHSGSRIASVRAWGDQYMAVLEVQDYGRGIPSGLLKRFNHTGNGVGVGLAGMRGRIEEFSGRLEICSTGNGTVVRAIVPLDEGWGGLN
jgi:two-component system NarL family sensor kinase